jgi:hypothetical protein
MRVSTDRITQLEKEVFIGHKADVAYNQWVMNYLNTQYVAKFVAFKDNCENLELLRYEIYGLNQLENAIQRDIETGKLAARQLSEGKDNE